ncbi:MAG: histidinol dehydrogenase [Candidatus Sulfobium sp.]|jgi:histidinol dehydrogenase
MMRIIRKNKEIADFIGRLRSRGADGVRSVEQDVRKILADVKKDGDRAVLKYTRRFDERKAARLRLDAAEIRRSAGRAELKAVKALEAAARRIRKFHENQRESSWSVTGGDVVLGQMIRPLARVGVYVPGGKAAYPSTVLMNVIPCQVAGVGEIAVCVPAPGGELNPYVMSAIRMLGVREVYRVGGAQAVGALAYGTESIRSVDKIVGPGNIYVATAKRLVFGLVDIDMIAGPSEILIIADESADPRFIAADLLSQAEHDELASPILVTDSHDLALEVSREVADQLSGLRRKKIAQASMESYGAAMVTRDLSRAAAIANLIAPEHLEIMTGSPSEFLPLIENAGAVFLGPWSPESLGDYAAGPNHTLPTGGTARFSSPLGVYDFYKRSSVVGFTRKAFMRISRTVETVADIEGLEAHGNTIRIRKRGKRQ